MEDTRLSPVSMRASGITLALVVAFVAAGVVVGARRLVIGSLFPNDAVPTFPILDAAAAAAWCLIGAAIVLRHPQAWRSHRWLLLGAAILAIAEVASAAVTARIVDLSTNPFTFGTAAGRAQLLLVQSVGSVVRVGTAAGAVVLAIGLLAATGGARPRRAATAGVAILAGLALVQVAASLVHVLSTVARAATLQTSVLSAGVLVVQVLAFSFLALVAIGGAQGGSRPAAGWWLLAIGAVVPFTAIWLNSAIAVVSPFDAINVLTLASATQLLAAVLLIAGFWLGGVRRGEPATDTTVRSKGR